MSEVKNENFQQMEQPGCQSMAVDPPSTTDRPYKRHAPSSPEYSTIRNPRPLSEIDITRLSMSMVTSKRDINVALRDGNCTNAAEIKQSLDVMQESFNQIVQAYRVLAGRLDDYAELQVILEVAEAVCVIKETLKLASESTAKRSYADISAGPRMTGGRDPGTTRVLSTPRIHLSETTEFTVEPVAAKKSAFRTSADVKKKFIQSIRLSKYSLKTTDLFQLKSNAVRVIAEAFDIAKLANADELRDAGLCIKRKIYQN